MQENESSNQLMVFEGQEVEVFELKGDVLFNPYHVGACLDIADSTLREHVASMNEKQVVKVTNNMISNVGLTDFRKINNTGENFLTEAGVFKLIFKSRKPEAEKFQDWVTDEVLPALRKTGSYEIKNKKISQASPYRESVVIIQSYLKIGKLLGTAEPMTKAIAVEEVRRVTGLDHSRLLPLAHIEEVPIGVRELAKKLDYKQTEIINELTVRGFIERDKDNKIMPSAEAKRLGLGSVEPFKAPNSEHVGYHAKWFPTKVKNILNNKKMEVAA